MSDLAARECNPCRGGVAPLAGAELRRWHEELGNGWQLVDDHQLEKTYRFADFRAALAFTNRVGALAEEVGHHPEIRLAWGRVHLTIYTHKIDGLADADFIWAAKADRLLPAG
ncbi:MAG: 4a-hydroxytetrahydrobiopterin dehydratase [Acidobacteriota bacterium]|nr:4a-hydroxytetrahydrobiopterin dehydratase [Acidobacteriota bacterium]MDH3522283.1 4a-hydroxytetrahydrobiopterin dehydratase [Acidobacteriota bacterium]